MTKGKFPFLFEILNVELKLKINSIINLNFKTMKKTTITAGQIHCPSCGTVIPVGQTKCPNPNCPTNKPIHSIKKPIK